MPFTPMDMGYKMVADRHAQFVKDNPNGAVINNLERHTLFDNGTGFIVMRSEVYKDRATLDAGNPPDGVGHASMPIPGPTSFTKNSEVENAETSALGRALAMIGYHAKETMASGDEIGMKSGVLAPAKPVAEFDPTASDPAERAKLMNFGKAVLKTDAAGVKKWLAVEFPDILNPRNMTKSDVKAINARLAILKAAGATGFEGVVLDGD